MPCLPDYLITLTDAEFGSGSRATHLLQICLEQDKYDGNVARELVRTARGLSGESWPERQLAVLLLENQLLRIPPDQIREWDPILAELGVNSKPGSGIPVGELARRLSRLNRAHDAIRSTDCDAVAWGYFFRTARDISKLTLARYLFVPKEVVEEIARELEISQGAQTAAPGAPAMCVPADHAELAAYEAEILTRLCAGNRIYWVSEQCGSELNALVEYPLTSAVVVIKPPGSDVEFEIKRAGTRGPRRMDVIAERNGKDAPTSHRLFGGSLGWLGQREAESAELFSKIYRMVHGTECPCSRTVSASSVVTLPRRADATGSDLHILDYLTDREEFGDGFDETRRAMSICVAAFPSDTGVARASWEGEAGQTLRFIGQALPQQSIITGSSSFRLDRIALYLSGAGPEHYFGALGRHITRRDLQWLADSVLEEILGEVRVPPGRFVDYEQYLADAFRVPENRGRADANYISVMRQAGECWGTLLALRGFSDGESFVQRNVGLKSVWKDGNWQIRIVFMDHDDLTMAGSRYQYLWPQREVPGMLRDQVHLLGGPLSGDTIPGDVGALQGIYRTSSGVADAGVQSLQESLRDAYRKTQQQLDTNRELQNLFYPEFIARHRDFDRMVAGFLASDPAQIELWRAEATAYLNARGYGDELAAESVQAISQFRGFFERMRFLYAG